MHHSAKGILMKHDVTKRLGGSNEFVRVSVCACMWLNEWLNSTMWLNETSLKLVKAECFYACAQRGPRRKSPFFFFQHICLFQSVGDEKRQWSEVGRWWLLACFVWEGSLPLPALWTHRQTHRNSLYAAQSSLQRWWERVPQPEPIRNGPLGSAGLNSCHLKSG